MLISGMKITSVEYVGPHRTRRTTVPHGSRVVAPAVGHVAQSHALFFALMEPTAKTTEAVTTGKNKKRPGATLDGWLKKPATAAASTAE